MPDNKLRRDFVLCYRGGALRAGVMYHEGNIQMDDGELFARLDQLIDDRVLSVRFDMQLLENFDEIESASDAELHRMLQATQKRNQRGYFDKRIARIEAEIESRKKGEKMKSVEHIITDKGAFNLKYDFQLFNTSHDMHIAHDAARIAIEDNTDPATLDSEVQDAVRRFYTGVSVEPNPRLDRLIKEETERRKARRQAEIANARS